jgi:putative ABC transport system permease protein
MNREQNSKTKQNNRLQPGEFLKMLKNYFQIAFRYLTKYKVYSFINIFGFSIALVPVILTFLYIAYEFSYDKYNTNFDRIYRVVVEEKYYDRIEQSPIVPNPLAAAMKAEFPEIEHAVRIRNFSESFSFNGKNYLEENVIFADPGIFEVFSIDMIEGNTNTVLSDPYSIVLSESMAKKYFENKNPVGKTIHCGHEGDLIVKGVFKDIPKNSHFIIDFLIPAALLNDQKSITGISNDPTAWGFGMFYTYFLLKKNANPDELLSKFPAFLRKYSNNDYFNSSKIFFQPLKDIHLHSHLKTEFRENGDIMTIYLYLSVALIILIIAIINYVNLATARSSQRSKEIGVRKIIGAERIQLIRQLLGETVLITFCSFCITIILVELILPSFNTFVERDIHFNIFKNFDLFLAIVGFTVIVGICSGIYPALMLSSTQPISFFSHSPNVSRNPRFRSILVMIQFVLSIGLIFSSLVVRKQMNYISEKDLGYNKNNIVIIDIKNRKSKTSIESLKNELSQYPNIVSVSSSVNLPSETACGGGINWPGKPDNIRFEINYNTVDYNFIDLYEMKIIEGRKFSKEFPSDEYDAALISETAARDIGWVSPIGKIITYTSPYGTSNRKVIGVVKDFHMHSLFKKITPFYLVIDPKYCDYYLAIKIKPGNFQGTINYLKSKMEIFQPEFPFEYKFFSDIISESYRTENKLQTIFSTFSIFTIFIACLGLFGLISFTTEVRKKEIGIRKVLGATSRQISELLLKETMKLVILSSFLATPIAYFTMNKWLSNFAYRTEINIGMFLLAALIVYLIAIFAMILQVFKASVQNPVDIIKYE